MNSTHSALPTTLRCRQECNMCVTRRIGRKCLRTDCVYVAAWLRDFHLVRRQSKIGRLWSVPPPSGKYSPLRGRVCRRKLLGSTVCLATDCRPSSGICMFDGRESLEQLSAQSAKEELDEVAGERRVNKCVRFELSAVGRSEAGARSGGVVRGAGQR